MAKIELIHGDCMDYLKGCSENQFSLAIVDPEYGIGINKQSQGKGGGIAKKNDYKKKDWDSKPPPKEYFKELKTVTKSQIIWGGNYFVDYLESGPCWIVWDKDNGTTDFADCELAWTNFQTSVRKVKWKWAGMLQQDMKNKQIRIHPTEKPVALYRWLLQNYAKPGDTILDTHGGSMSIAIACYIEGFDLVCIEKDKDYFEAAKKRYEDYVANNPRLFQPEELRQPIQQELF